MTTTNNTETDTIRAELKAIGLTARDVSVRFTSGGCAIRVEIKTPKANRAQVERIAQKQSRIRYDEACGEILAGGNLFVHVAVAPSAIESEMVVAASILDVLDVGESADLFGYEVVRTEKYGFRIYSETLRHGVTECNTASCAARVVSELATVGPTARDAA